MSDDEPFRKWAVIVAALGIDSEHPGFCAHQQHVLLTDMAEQGLAVEIARRDALGEIRPGRLRLFFSHAHSRLVTRPPN